jgi:hypothetical protein
VNRHAPAAAGGRLPDYPAEDTPEQRERRYAKLPASEQDPDRWAEAYWDTGYTYCPADKEWHRPPECAIDEAGQPSPPWKDACIDDSDGAP